MARETREGGRISEALLDELLAGQDPAEVFRDGSLIDDLKKAVAERALDAEMDAHLEAERTPDNRRNGHNRKRVLTDDGALDLEVPRDRAEAARRRLGTNQALFSINRFGAPCVVALTLWWRKPGVGCVLEVLAARNYGRS